MLNIEGKQIKILKFYQIPLNNYFTKVVDESVSRIKLEHNQTKQHSYLEYLVHEFHQHFPSYIFNKLLKKKSTRSSLKWKNSCSYDDAQSKAVKLIMPFTSYPFIYICNRMLSTDTFPTRLTFSQVLPIFKKR
jgi:hypothetical protein